MNKIYILFALLTTLASCSDWKYSNGVKSAQPEYQYAREKIAVVEKDRNDQVEIAEPESVRETASIVAEKDSSLFTGEVAINDPFIHSREITVIDHEEDSVEVVSPEVVRQALHSENQGRKSRNLSIAGLLLTFTYFFAVVGMVFMIIALIKGINSLKAHYNTPEGVRMARTGVVISSIVLGLYIVIMLLAIFLILALL